MASSFSSLSTARPTQIVRFPEGLDELYLLLQDAAEGSGDSIRHVLKQAAQGRGLDLEEAALLLMAGAEWSDRIFQEAGALNRRVKGKQVTFYGVVYIHDYCVNLCTYCGDSKHAHFSNRRLLSVAEFRTDVKALLDRHPLKEICVLMGEDPRRFEFGDLLVYLASITEFYDETIILNIPPLSAHRFAELRAGIPEKNRLQFRVFQETYDRDIYAREHTEGPKKDFAWRVASQARALEAGIDEAGHGILYGINDKANGSEFDTLAMIAHAQDLHRQFGRWPRSMSFPRVQPAPDIDFHPRASISTDRLVRFVAVAKLAVPQIDTIITCRETAEVRRQLRPVVNIEDFAARPGPGGNSIAEVRQQMFLPDMRSGEEVRREMLDDGYCVR
jgi:2-iminoacetate synthase